VKERFMSEEKKKRDFAINMTQIKVLGRVIKQPKEKKNGNVTVSFVVPSWVKGKGMQFVPFTVDVVGDSRDRAKSLETGDYFGCTCRFVERQVTDDNGDNKTLLTMQMDEVRPAVFRRAEVGEGYDPLNPEMDDVCQTSVLLAGRCFIRKKQLEEGQSTPIVREGKNGKYCYVTLRYEDPFQEIPSDGSWPKSIFIDLSLSGKTAEIVGESCRNRAQLVVIGELAKKEADFTVKGKTPKMPVVHVIPGGFKFVNLDGASGPKKKDPEPVKEYEADDTDGIDGLDDDLPF